MTEDAARPKTNVRSRRLRRGLVASGIVLAGLVGGVAAQAQSTPRPSPSAPVTTTDPTRPPMHTMGIRW
jgi:hypothetical protein